MKPFIKIESSPAVIQTNFEAAKKSLTAKLKKYDVVVTIDTVKDAKKLATDLNKQATELDTRRKEAVYNVSMPIRSFEAEMKILVTMCKDGREKINAQVVKFEAVTKEKINVLLQQYRQELWEASNVSDRFKSAEIESFILLSNITGKDELTAKARREVEAVVDRDKQQQNEVELRIAQLENRCYKAGLHTVLTEAHVEAFLFAPEGVYNSSLDALIYVEIERQKKAEKIIQDRINEEARVAAEAKESARRKAAITSTEVVKGLVTDQKPEDKPTPEVEKPEEPLDRDYVEHIPTTPAKEKVDAPVDESVKSDSIVRVVTATFEVSVPNHITNERIKLKLEKMLIDAGITSLTSITIGQ